MKQFTGSSRSERRIRAERSYTASLMQQGIDKVLKKVGEEAAELIIAGKGGDRREIVYEAADLFFHTLILLGMYDIPPEEVYAGIAPPVRHIGCRGKRVEDQAKWLKRRKVFG